MTTIEEENIIQINSLAHDGRGIANLRGKTLFISGSLPGEKVTYKITKKHSRFLEAEVISIIEAAPERTKPICPHFSICGGCSLQQLSDHHQLLFKQKILLEQLFHFGKITPLQIDPPLAHQNWGYRRKARLGVRFVKKKNRVLVGFREKQSHYLAEIATCPVLHPSVSNNLSALSELVESLSQKEAIPQIEIAVGDRETALVFRHLNPLTEQDIDKLKQFGEQQQYSIYLQEGSPDKLIKLYPESHPDLTYSLPDFGLEMKFRPLDFIQINGEVNQLLIKKAVEWLNPSKTEIVLDLFCGIGNFTLPLALFAGEVVGVEGSLDMVNRAASNALHNHLHNVSFHATNLTSLCNEEPWLQKQYDKILLDPPRSGAKEILPFLGNSNAKSIVYISCNPATLARDAGELVHQFGYQLQRVSIVNMFPHTSHIEAIALFLKE